MCSTDHFTLPAISHVCQGCKVNSRLRMELNLISLTYKVGGGYKTLCPVSGKMLTEFSVKIVWMYTVVMGKRLRWYSRPPKFYLNSDVSSYHNVQDSVSEGFNGSPWYPYTIERYEYHPHSTRLCPTV